MSRLPTGPSREWVSMALAVQEAVGLGAEFRISGDAVVIIGGQMLPATLAEALQQNDASGYLLDYLDGTEINEPALRLLAQLEVEPVLVETRRAARDAVRQLIADLQANGGTLGLDIETSPRAGYGAPRPPVAINGNGALSAKQPEYKDRAGLDPHQAAVALVQLYAGGSRCFVFGGEALSWVLHSHWLNRQRVVVHNASFEASFLRHPTAYRAPPGRRRQGEVHCSMQAAGLMFGVGFRGENRSLAKAARNVLGLAVSKELQTSDWSARKLSSGQLAYAAADAVIAYRIWPILWQKLRESGRGEAYELQRRVVPAIADMQLRGLGFDRDEHARQCESWARELTTARREYHRLTGEPPPTTPVELRGLLAGVLDEAQLSRWPRTVKTGELSTSYRHLQRLANIPGTRPVLTLLAMEKLISTFGENLAAQVNPVTGRLHCEYNIAAAKSGRFSSSHPNLQQLPARRMPEFRRCIVAAPGNLLVGADWNQVEMRAAAWISGDRALTEVFRSGKDMHRMTAAAVAGIPPDEVTSEQRQGAKAINFGSIYGIGARGLVQSAFTSYGVEMTEDQAQQALDRFAATRPDLARWQRKNYRASRQQGRIHIGCGRVVEAAWEADGLSFPKCCNLPIQGICADAMLRAIVATDQALGAAGVRGGLVACVHDELLIEVCQEDAELAGEILEQTMTEAFVKTFPGAPTTGLVSLASGRSWFELK